MFTTQIYGKTISGKTYTEIKRKASRIANNYYKPFDCMVITDLQTGAVFKACRRNKIYPNNTIEFGKWR